MKQKYNEIKVADSKIETRAIKDFDYTQSKKDSNYFKVYQIYFEVVYLLNYLI